MTGVLLDTNVLSEPLRPDPDENVAAFLSEDRDFYISAISINEMRFGAARIQAGRRKYQIDAYLSRVIDAFSDRTIAVDAEVAAIAGDMRATREAAGHKISVDDGLIAACAAAHSLRIATRNTKDFEGLGVELINPWNVPA